MDKGEGEEEGEDILRTFLMQAFVQESTSDGAGILEVVEAVVVAVFLKEFELNCGYGTTLCTP